MTQLRTHLVIRNGRDMRLVRRVRDLASNEVAIEIIINTQPQPQVVGTVTVDLPAPAPTTATVGTIDYAEEETWREAGE